MMDEREKLQEMADYCKNECPVCVRARKKGKGFLFWMVRIERRVCPFCRAYEKVYGKPAYR